MFFSAIKYLPFGETRSGTVPTDKQFTGQRLDGTGLYYYNARYYDPLTGRFISADTIIPNPMNPQYLNRYSYCLNNPLKYIDPSGHRVFINDWDVRFLDSVIESGNLPYLPLEILNELGKTLNSPEYLAYRRFRNLYYASAHMAWTMEQNTEYTVTITLEQTRYFPAITEKNGCDFTIKLDPRSLDQLNIYYYLDPFYQGLAIFGQVYQFILDTRADLNFLSAFKDVTIDYIISLNEKFKTAVNVCQFIYTSKMESIGVALVEALISYSPVGPIATFLSNLLGQQDYFELMMWYTQTPYPFQS
jgi:RHS repeat-associated protein